MTGSAESRSTPETAAVSVVIPTRNEPALADALRQLRAALGERPRQLIIVDDSDAERQAALQAELAGAGDVLMVPGRRRGKGDAVRHGAELATGEVVFVIDADLPVALGRVDEFIAAVVRDGNDIVIAERVLSVDKARRHPLRFVFSAGLQLVQRAVIFQSSFFYDTQCGFKAYRREVLQDLARVQIVDGGMFDVEYLFIARQRGYRFHKVWVTPNEEVRESRIDLKRCLRDDPRDLLRIKLHSLRRGYGR